MDKLEKVKRTPKADNSNETPAEIRGERSAEAKEALAELSETIRNAREWVAEARGKIDSLPEDEVDPIEVAELSARIEALEELLHKADDALEAAEAVPLDTKAFEKADAAVQAFAPELEELQIHETLS